MDEEFLDLMPNPVIVYDAFWRVKKINRAALDVLWHSNHDDLLGKEISHIVHHDDLAIITEICNQTSKNDVSRSPFEVRHLRSDGSEVKMASCFSKLASAHPSGDTGYLESGFAPEEVFDKYNKQREKLQCWSALAGNVPGLTMLLIDEQLQIHCSVGNEKQRRPRIQPGFVTPNLEHYFPQNIISIIKPMLKIAFESTPVSREFADGKAYYSVRLNPLTMDNGKVMCVIILQNITETKLFEKKLQRSTKEAEEANEAKSTFVARMSHEIRTPLNAVIGFAEQMNKTRLSKTQNNYLKIINNASEHLLSIVDDILVLSKIEAGQVEFEEVPFKIGQVLKTVKNLFDLRYKKKKLSFNIIHDLSLDDKVVIGDPGRLRQVLINLINNAIKFTHKGGITVNCAPVKITKKQITIRFSVTDTGIGIPAEELEGIFAPFRQVDNSVGRSYFGSGLGLSISKDLIESQGGTISVKSVPDKGSTFIFNITYKLSHEPIPQDVDSEPIPSGISLSHIKLLFVDDDPVNQMLGKEILRHYKIKTVFAGSGDEAIKKFTPGRFHIVFLDINMPVTSGIDVARHIRKTEQRVNKNPAVKIIAMTANVLKRHINQFLDAGMDDIMIKPFREEDVYEMVVKHSREIAPLPKKKKKLRGNGNNKSFNLAELEKFTRGDKEFTLLMLDTFIENSEHLLDKIKTAFDEDDYGSIAEAAHRLLPSFEQLGLKEAMAMLKKIDSKFLRKKNIRKDLELIQAAINEIELALNEIKQAKSQIK